MTSWYLEKATKSSAPVLVDLWNHMDFSFSSVVYKLCDPANHITSLCFHFLSCNSSLYTQYEL